MKYLPTLVLAACLACQNLFAQTSVPGIITYQGRVTVAGQPYTGTGLFKFALVDGGVNTSRQAYAGVDHPGGALGAVTVWDAGYGYLTPPNVTFNSPLGGSGGTATATVGGPGGPIAGITINNPGSGYMGLVDVIIDPPPANLAYTSLWSHDGTSLSGNAPFASWLEVPVKNGLFTVALGDTNVPNMSALPPEVLTNNDVHLRIWFDVGEGQYRDGGVHFEQLTPDQPLTAAPYALVAQKAMQLEGTSTGPVTLNNSGNSFSGNGAGLTAVNASTLGGLTASSFLAATNANNFWKLGGNAGTTANNFLGTTDNQPLELRVNGHSALRLGTNWSVSLGQVATASGINATAIGQLSAASAANSMALGYTATASGISSTAMGFGSTARGVVSTAIGYGAMAYGYASIAMGQGTSADGDFSTAIGYFTTASGTNSTAMGNATTASGSSSTAMGNGTTASGDYSIAMGIGTTASGYASTAMGNLTRAMGDQSTAMGFHTLASGDVSTAMGYKTTASGDSSTAMGFTTTASAHYSTAMGHQALAGHTGSFVWADSKNEFFSSIADDSVSFRCRGGVRFTSGDNGLLSLAQTVAWSPGNASWSFSSDRNLKDRIASVDQQSVLDKLAQMPIFEWSYKGYDQRHIGPMAQDFHKFFPLNEDDKALQDADLHGVALAAIQGLNQKLEEQKAENADLKARLEKLEQLINLKNGAAK